MTETEWNACTDPEPMLEFLRGKPGERKPRLFAVACCRRVWHLLVHNSSQNAVEVAERFADGAATEHELEAAGQDAWEFTNHTVNNDERFFDLDEGALNASDVAAWATEWPAEPLRAAISAQRSLGASEGEEQTRLLRCIFGSPFHPVSFDPAWRAATVLALAQTIYDGRQFTDLPILADALEDAGCNNLKVLTHCRQPGVHTRGCWVVDLVLGKE